MGPNFSNLYAMGNLWKEEVMLLVRERNIKNESNIHDLQVLDKVDMPLCERPKKPDHCPTDIYNILTSCCWAHEPHQRARFSVLQKMCKEVGSL